MHPALAMWIWAGALSKPQSLFGAEAKQKRNNNVSAFPRAVQEKPLPVPMLLRLDHMRMPSRSGLQLARFHSERYRKF